MHAGRGTVGKTAIVGVKDRASNRVRLSSVDSTDKVTPQSFIASHTANGAEIYTDEYASNVGIPKHATVRHSIGSYVDGDVHTNEIESVWAMLKRGITGTYHHVSDKHAGRYAVEFAGWHNARPKDTIDQVNGLVKGMDGKRLRYQYLIA